MIGVCEGFAIVSAEIQDDWAVEWPPRERPLSSYPQPCVAAVDDILAGELCRCVIVKVFLGGGLSLELQHCDAQRKCKSKLRGREGKWK